MLCPCKFIEDDIKEYGTCHCALFGSKDLTPEDWEKSNKRLQAEYRVPLNIQDGVLDTRGKPRDKFRDLPIPDAMHQLKSALIKYDKEDLTLIVETEQESINLEKIAKYRGFGYSTTKDKDSYRVDLKLK